jgi:hypothetical protein
LSRKLAVEFARSRNLQYEYVSLSLDTAEADLKTRKELISQQVVFSDQVSMVV